MASSQPIIRQVSWSSILSQLIVLGFIYLVLYVIGLEDPLLNTFIVYLVLSVSLKMLIPFHHRKGIRLFKNMQYFDAIKEFEKSYDFFKKNHWIDRFRAIVLLSSSRISYTEMALANIGFCYGQIGNGVKSREYYEKTLREFPDSKLAEAALRMYDAANK